MFVGYGLGMALAWIIHLQVQANIASDMCQPTIELHYSSGLSPTIFLRVLRKASSGRL